MRIADAQWVPSTPHQTWNALTDPAVLRQCLPGCVRVEQRSPTEYAVTIRAKVGGMETDYEGEVLLSDVQPGQGATLAFEGKGPASGLAIGTAQVVLQARDEGTRVSYTLAAMAGGKLASLGEPVLLKAGNKIVDRFFTAFFDYAGHQPRLAAADGQAMPEQAPHGALHAAWSWVLALGVMAALVWYHWQ